MLQSTKKSKYKDLKTYKFSYVSSFFAFLFDISILYGFNWIRRCMNYTLSQQRVKVFCFKKIFFYLFNIYSMSIPDITSESIFHPQRNFPPIHFCNKLIHISTILFCTINILPNHLQVVPW